MHLGPGDIRKLKLKLKDETLSSKPRMTRKVKDSVGASGITHTYIKTGQTQEQDGGSGKSEEAYPICSHCGIKTNGQPNKTPQWDGEKWWCEKDWYERA